NNRFRRKFCPPPRRRNSFASASARARSPCASSASTRSRSASVVNVRISPPIASSSVSASPLLPARSLARTRSSSSTSRESNASLFARGNSAPAAGGCAMRRALEPDGTRGASALALVVPLAGAAADAASEAARVRAGRESGSAAPGDLATACASERCATIVGRSSASRITVAPPTAAPPASIPRASHLANVGMANRAPIPTLAAVTVALAFEAKKLAAATPDNPSARSARLRVACLGCSPAPARNSRAAKSSPFRSLSKSVTAASLQRMHYGLKLFPRSAQARRDRPARNGQQLCNLEHRMVFDLEQHERRAQLARQLIERAIEQRKFGAALGRLLRIITRIDREFERLSVGHFAPPARRAPKVGRHAQRR